jgi:CDP-paratose 2-epimerase
MKLIVTGVAGFIGSHIAERFLRRGAVVVGIDNLSRPGNYDNLLYLSGIATPDQFRFYHGDIRSFADVERIVSEHRDVEAIIHEAGQVAVTTSVLNPRADFESNALGTFNLLEAARSYAPQSIFLFASTNKVYGGLEHVGVQEKNGRYTYISAPQGISEEETLDFHSPYGCSKGSAEQYVRDYYRIYGLRSVVFRQSCIYGERQYGMEDQGWVAWFTIAALFEHPITIYGDGMQIRDLLWVDDLVQIYERAIERIEIAAGQIYNCGGGPENTLSLLELIQILESALGRRIQYSHAEWRPGDQRVFIANCAKALRELDWEPRVSPREGVLKLLDWTRRMRPSIERVIARKSIYA